ncbi:MAG: hypothetical protein LKK58_05080 [Oscillospiraceae bacterium]|jgi:dipicolinate synthase subunit A|nr:hypothetical protein [Oscillospiraceae bacterium]MCI2206002.1 hypothetical protein [Oscillospiraceae bacterium]
MRGAVFANDERIYFAAEALKKLGMKIDCANDYSRGQNLLVKNPQNYDFVLLPVRGTEDGTILQSAGTSLFIGDFLKGLSEGTPVFTGRRTEYLRQLNLTLYDPFKDPEVSKKNAGLTAEGVLWFLLEYTKKSLFENSYDVVGAGHTGKAITEILRKLRLPVRQAARNGHLDTIPMEQWERETPSDVVVVTVPALVLPVELAESWEKPVFVLDISSGQVGADPKIAELKNITYYAAPPLPSKVAPESAGVLIADYIGRIMSDKNIRKANAAPAKNEG